VSSNILENSPSGSDFFNKPIHFRPEVTVIFRASLLPGNTEWLAWVSPDDDIWSNNPICSELLSGEASDIIVDWCVRPMSSKDFLAVSFDFAERDCFKSGFFEANAKSPYTTK
jgi:hypothetical protein